MTEPEANKKPTKVAALNPETRERLLSKLREARESAGQGGLRYPCTLRELLDACGLEVKDSIVKACRELLPVAAKKEGKKYTTPGLLGSLVALPEDESPLATSAPLLIHLLKRASMKASKAFSIPDLATKTLSSTQQKKRFKDHWNRALSTTQLPPGVAAIPTGRTTLLFLEENLIRRPQPLAGAALQPGAGRGAAHPATSTTAVGPAAAGPLPSTEGAPAKPSVDGPASNQGTVERLLDAHRRVDAELGTDNYVLLSDWRAALPELARGDFDSALDELRRDRRVSLDASDGRHDRLTEEQLAQGIEEAGQTLVYAQRREA